MRRTVKWEKITDQIALSFEILPINKILARAIAKSIYFTPCWKQQKKRKKKPKQKKNGLSNSWIVAIIVPEARNGFVFLRSS